MGHTRLEYSKVDGSLKQTKRRERLEPRKKKRRYISKEAQLCIFPHFFVLYFVWKF